MEWCKLYASLQHDKDLRRAGPPQDWDDWQRQRARYCPEPDCFDPDCPEESEWHGSR